jgi:4-hydroxybenzoate polyprenyltransferase
MRKIAPYIQLMRPHQWVKNLFVIAPVIFSYSFLDFVAVQKSLLAFALFSLLASSVYVFNDIIDLPRDRQNIFKKKRPLTRGLVPVRGAYVLGVLLGGIALLGGYLLSPLFFLTVLAYAIVNAFYTLLLKHMVILDMFSIAISLVLRVLAGIAAIGVIVSPWILVVTFFIGLFIISIKRILEHDLVEKSGQRSVVRIYDRGFLRHSAASSLIITLVFYVLYVIFEVRSLIFLVTILPVAYGLLRFLWLAESNDMMVDNPSDIILCDRPLQTAIAIFSVLVVVLFSLPFSTFFFITPSYLP